MDLPTDSTDSLRLLIEQGVCPNCNTLNASLFYREVDYDSFMWSDYSFNSNPNAVAVGECDNCGWSKKYLLKDAIERGLGLREVEPRWLTKEKMQEYFGEQQHST